MWNHPNCEKAYHKLFSLAEALDCPITKSDDKEWYRNGRFLVKLSLHDIELKIILGFDENWNRLVVALAHEVGHLVDYLDRGLERFFDDLTVGGKARYSMEMIAWTNAKKLLSSLGAYQHLEKEFAEVKEFSMSSYIESLQLKEMAGDKRMSVYYPVGE